jgi:hypothetical protein
LPTAWRTNDALVPRRPLLATDWTDTDDPWKAGLTLTILDRGLTPLYTKCADCHLFVDDNPAYTAGSGLAPLIHLHRGTPEDEEIDDSHEPRHGMVSASLDWWRVNGPAPMRARFVPRGLTLAEAQELHESIGAAMDTGDVSHLVRALELAGLVVCDALVNEEAL